MCNTMFVHHEFNSDTSKLSDTCLQKSIEGYFSYVNHSH